MLAAAQLAKQAVERRATLNVLYTTGQTVTDVMKVLFVDGAITVETDVRD